MTQPEQQPTDTAPVTAQEPVFTAAVLSAAVGAVITLLVAFGVHLSTEQTAAILGVVSILGPFIVAVVVRRKVTPNGKVLAFVARVPADATTSTQQPLAGEASGEETGAAVAVVAVTDPPAEGA